VLGGGPNRIGAFERGEIDAIFDEAIHGWAGRGAKAGMRFMPIDEPHIQKLEAAGFRRGVIARDHNPPVPEDVPTVDFSGWPIYTSENSADKAIRAFCIGLQARADKLIMDGTGLPLEQMVRDTPEGPLEVPFHPAAEAYWREAGYLK